MATEEEESEILDELSELATEHYNELIEAADSAIDDGSTARAMASVAATAALVQGFRLLRDYGSVGKEDLLIQVAKLWDAVEEEERETQEKPS